MHQQGVPVPGGQVSEVEVELVLWVLHGILGHDAAACHLRTGTSSIQSAFIPSIG